MVQVQILALLEILESLVIQV